MSTNFAKMLVSKRGNDVKLWRHKQRKPNTNDHHMILTQNPLHENFLRTPLENTNVDKSTRANKGLPYPKI